jgi:hypothetical protein
MANNEYRAQLAIRPLFGRCQEFRAKPEDAPTPVSAIIAPVRITEDGRIAWSCSVGQSCLSPLCRYSAYHRPQR